MVLLTRRERIGLAGGIRFEVCLPPSDQRETSLLLLAPDSDSRTNNQPFSSAIPFIH